MRPARTARQLACSAAVCLLWMTNPLVAAADDEEPTVGPDRPDVSDNTVTIEPGLAQLELGGSFTRANADETSVATPFLLRLGLSRAAELRFSGDGFVRQTSGPMTVTGAGDLGLGAKIRFWDEDGALPSLGIEPGLKLPVASRAKGLGSGNPDGGASLLIGKDLPLDLHTDANLSVGYVAESVDGKGPDVQVGASVSTGLALLDGRINPFWEIYWVSPEEDGGHVVSTDFGVVAIVHERIALDASADIGLTHAASRFTVGGGLTVLFGSSSK